MNHQNSSRNPSPDSAGSGEFSLVALISGILRGFAVMLAAALLLTLVGGIVAYSNADPSRFEKIVGLATLYLSTAAGSFASVKFSRQSAVLCGVFFAAVSLLILFAVTAIIPFDCTAEKNTSLLFHSMIVVSSVIGALVGASAHGKRHKKKKAPSFRKKK